MGYITEIYSIEFELIDALGDRYSWDVEGPWVVDQYPPDLEGFPPLMLDLHLLANNEVSPRLYSALHEVYSHVGDSGVFNIAQGTRPYYEDFQGINLFGYWEPVSVPEPSSLFLLGVGIAGIAAARRKLIARP